ncbi:hypothetical protein B0H14DRAFT_2585400 [Mycena olivaceomarginata]|nr:hypothetical protein B0H14DRAFT_2585400 [Mycena olivaceomarginata]
MAEIRKRWSRAMILEATKRTSTGMIPDCTTGMGLSELDRSLARFRGILERKYQNDHDWGYTYIDSHTAKSYPLTPTMMKEWARAMHDGETNRDNPPGHWDSMWRIARLPFIHLALPLV